MSRRRRVGVKGVKNEAGSRGLDPTCPRTFRRGLTRNHVSRLTFRKFYSTVKFYDAIDFILQYIIRIYIYIYMYSGRFLNELSW